MSRQKKVLLAFGILSIVVVISGIIIYFLASVDTIFVDDFPDIDTNLSNCSDFVTVHVPPYAYGCELENDRLDCNKALLQENYTEEDRELYDNIIKWQEEEIVHCVVPLDKCGECQIWYYNETRDVIPYNELKQTGVGIDG